MYRYLSGPLFILALIGAALGNALSSELLMLSLAAPAVLGLLTIAIFTKN